MFAPTKRRSIFHQLPFNSILRNLIRRRRFVLLCAVVSVGVWVLLSHVPDSGSMYSVKTDSYPSSQSSIFRVLHYNTHAACAHNLAEVLRTISKSDRSLHYNLSTYDPSKFGYGMSHSHAVDLLNSGFFSRICKDQDLIIVSDTIPHARGLLLSFFEHSSALRCDSNILLEITNRFDYGITDEKDRKLYYALFRKIADYSLRNERKKIIWVANNYYEKAYIELRLGVQLPFMHEIRPLGMFTGNAYKPKVEGSNEFQMLTTYHNNTNVYELLAAQKIANLTVLSLEHSRYGGPQALRGFKAYLDFPYQVSTMKLYENLAAGVVLLVPSPPFLEKIWKNGDHEIFYHMWDLRRFPWNSWLHFRKPSHNSLHEFPIWSGFMDYYSPDFAPYIYYFGSWEELRNLASKSRDEIDIRGVWLRKGDWYETERVKTFESWRRILLSLV